MPAKLGDVLVATRVGQEMCRQLDASAHARDLSRSQFIRDALRKELQ